MPFDDAAPYCRPKPRSHPPVQALVLRSQAVSLGELHVDTQLVGHNLGCVLDRLGRGHKALELLEQAHKVRGRGELWLPTRTYTRGAVQ